MMQFDWQQLFDEVKVRGQFGSDAQLAEHLGLSRAQISAWRTGKSEMGTLVKLKLLDALGHDSLHAVMHSLWPVRNRNEQIRQHARLLERVGRGANAVVDVASGTVHPDSDDFGINRLLAALPPDEQARIRPHLSPVSMDPGQVVYESGDALRHVYLPTTAVISMLHVMDNGVSAEIAIVGKDGLLGVALFMGSETMPNRAIVQSAGLAYRLSAQIAREEFVRGGALQRLFLRYTQTLITQMAQTVVCNRHHSTAQQFCRWLLLSLDRMDSNRLHMTQNLIASMLGVRRASVTNIAKALQDLGVLRYSQEVLEVIDRAALETSACECYALVEHECRRLFSAPSPPGR